MLQVKIRRLCPAIWIINKAVIIYLLLLTSQHKTLKRRYFGVFITSRRRDNVQMTPF